MTRIRSKREPNRVAGGWGARLRVALLLVFVLSLLPAPLTGPVAAQTPDPPAIPEPPAQAVRLLERLRDRGTEQQAKPRRQGPSGARHRARRAQTITRKGCAFRVQGHTWTLLHSCKPRGTIVIPTGVTLDGHNRQMIVTGNIRRFDGAVVVAGFGRANVRNLRIEGKAGLTGGCPDLSAGILFFFASGTIANVTIRNIEPDATGCLQSAGIFAIGDKRLNILNSTVQGAGANGVILQGLVGGTIAGNDFRIGSAQALAPHTGIQLGGTSRMVLRNNDFRPGGANPAFGIIVLQNANLSIFGNRFQNLAGGIQVTSVSIFQVPSTVVIRDNQMSGMIISGISVFGGSVLVLRNSVAGPPTLGNIGFSFGPGTTGAANTNTIANFTCGIDNDSAVTLAGNAFINNTAATC